MSLGELYLSHNYELFIKDLDIALNDAKKFKFKLTSETLNLDDLDKKLTKLRQKVEFENSTYIEQKIHEPVFCPIGLFEVMDFGRLETAHTRMLSWLLDSKESHQFGTLFLDELLKLFSDEIYDTSLGYEVKCESNLNENNDRVGRADILVLGNDWLLIIEAKTDSNERKDQLSDYDGWIEKINYINSRKTKIFLTKDRSIPKTSKQDWVSLSYYDLVVCFNKIAQQRELHKTHLNTYPFLKYYLSGLLKTFCNQRPPYNSFRVNNYLKKIYGV